MNDDASTRKFWLCGPSSGVGLRRSAGNKPAFEIADVHVSPRGAWVKKVANNMQGGLLNAGRYELRRATMLDLIRIAYKEWSVLVRQVYVRK